MKKSEAIKKIQLLLESRGYVGNSDDGEVLLEILVDDIGMLPPPGSLTYRDYQYLSGSILDKFHRWEPEE